MEQHSPRYQKKNVHIIPINFILKYKTTPQHLSSNMLFKVTISLKKIIYREK